MVTVAILRLFCDALFTIPPEPEEPEADAGRAGAPEPVGRGEPGDQTG